MNVLLHDGDHAVSSERPLSRANFKEDDAQAINVAATIAHMTLRLLWRDIERRTNAGTVESSSGSTEQLDDAEVGENGFPHRIARGIALV